MEELITFLDQGFRYSVEFPKSYKPSIWITIVTDAQDYEAHIQIFEGPDQDDRAFYTLWKGEDIVEVGNRSFSGLLDLIAQFVIQGQTPGKEES